MPINPTRDEAVLFNHFIRNLGRWLDCTNASRIFTLSVAEKAKACPILYHALLCFAARHRRDERAGEAAYERCIALLLHRLNEDPTNYDEMLLSAVLLLHFADQLDVPSRQAPRDIPHLRGTSSILHATQSSSFVHPAATTLRDAAFWIYVRQCLYNATVRQEPLDLDFSLQLHPTPDKIQRDSHPLAWLTIDTAWANQILWNTACVANFCFPNAQTQNDSPPRIQQWQELWDKNKTWLNSRPSQFDPIGTGSSGHGQVFSDIWFTADWHVISHVFYHLSSILLLRYKPTFNLPARWAGGHPSLTDRTILEHARAICSACKSSTQNAQLFIVLCHTVFVWSPFMSDRGEQKEVLRLLRLFEQTHSWRTEWIVDALKTEWGMD